MAKLCISTQWDDDFLRECADAGAYEVYGSMRTGAIGSARPAACLPEVSREHARRHVELAHQRGLRFNYVINAPCLGNMEFDADGRRAIREYLMMVDGLGVDMVTVAIPHLIEIIKTDFPHIQVKASEIANVDSAQRAQFFVNDLKVDALTLDIVINRDFRVLRSIRRAVPPSVELEIVVNPACLFHCPYHDYHNNIVGHSGQEGHHLRGFYMDYCMMRCVPTHLSRPAELLKARWVRPEDMGAYEAVGIDRFKISNRVGPIRLGRTCLEEYSRRSCADLARLITPLSLNLEQPPGEQLDGFSHEAWWQMTQIWGMRGPRVHIDNAQLDGFLEYFKHDRCYGQCDAGGCTYCADWAARAVRVDQDEVARYAEMVGQMIEPLLSLGAGLRRQGAPLATGGAVWPTDIEALFEEIVRPAPAMFQDMARATIRGRAEEFARQRDQVQVRIEKEDLVRAAIGSTPAPFRPELIETLKSLGLEVPAET